MPRRLSGQRPDGARHVRLIGEAARLSDTGKRAGAAGDLGEGAASPRFGAKSRRAQSEDFSKSPRDGCRSETIVTRPIAEVQLRVLQQICGKQIRPVAGLTCGTDQLFAKLRCRSYRIRCCGAQDRVRFLHATDVESKRDRFRYDEIENARASGTEAVEMHLESSVQQHITPFDAVPSEAAALFVLS